MRNQLRCIILIWNAVHFSSSEWIIITVHITIFSGWMYNLKDYINYYTRTRVKAQDSSIVNFYQSKGPSRVRIPFSYQLISQPMYTVLRNHGEILGMRYQNVDTCSNYKRYINFSSNCREKKLTCSLHNSPSRYSKSIKNLHLYIAW